MAEEVLLSRAVRRTHEWVDELAEKLRAAKLPEPVGDLLLLIRDTYRDPAEYPIYLLQRQAGATEWHMKLFRRELGITPGELQSELRFETAWMMLRDTPLTVKAIARLVGYETSGGLRKLFNTLCGMAPSDVRFHLRRIVPEQRALGDELFSWYFRVRYHRGELGIDYFRAALAWFRDRFGPS